MIDRYEYTDVDGDRLAIVASTDPGVIIHAEPGARIHAKDVPDVIRAILARNAASQGRDGADPLAHIRADLDATIDEPGARYTQAEVDASQAAQGRILDDHMPLLLALGAYALGDDAPIWDQLKHVQGQRDFANERAEHYKTQRDYARESATVNATHRVLELAAAEQLRAEVARLRTAWHSAKRRAQKHLAARGHARGDAEQFRAAANRRYRERDQARAHAEQATAAWHSTKDQLRAVRGQRNEALATAEQLRAELDTIRAESAAADAATAKWDAEHAEFVAYGQALRATLGEVLGALGISGAASITPDKVRRWHRVYGGAIPAPEAHPPVDEYRVQHWEQADADLPSEGWTAFSSAQDTADEATATMRRRRRIRPDMGPMRVIRVRKSYTVVTTEGADILTLDRDRTEQAEPARVLDTGTYDNPDDTTTVPAGANAEDCPKCRDKNLTYPWICTGHPTPDAMTADEWNARYPVGTPVNARIKPGTLYVTATRTPAWTLGSGHAVVSVDGHTGGIWLAGIEPRPAPSDLTPTPPPA